MRMNGTGLNPAVLQMQYNAMLEKARGMELELDQVQLQIDTDQCQLIVKGTGEPVSLEVYEDCQPAEILEAFKQAYAQFSKLRDAKAKELVHGK